MTSPTAPLHRLARLVNAPLEAFRNDYPSRPPQRPSAAEELVEIGPSDGLLLFEEPAGHLNHVAAPPTNEENAGNARYLWVIAHATTPYVLEACDFARLMPLGLIKHTNLTGGAEAHCGGEAWFINERTVIINGRSGRYGPRDEEQLRRAGLALKAYGYSVGMLGFDETNVPMAIVVGEEDVQWL